MSETSRGVRWTGAIAAALAAISILLGATSTSWWESEKNELSMGVGARGVELCQGGSCVTRGLDGLGGASTSWPKLGQVAFSVGWVAGLFLAAAAVGAALASRSRWSIRLGQASSAASLFALAVCAGFAWMYPGFDGLTASWGLAAYGGGAAIGVGAGGLLIAAGGSRRAP